MPDYIELEVISDRALLADRAIEYLRSKWPDWVPQPAELAVIQIEALAPMAQNAAEVAARVPAAIFRTYGTYMVGVPYLPGARAVATVTFTLIPSTEARKITAGTEINVDGFMFATDEDEWVEPGPTVVAGVPVTAGQEGDAFNDLPGNVVAHITASRDIVNVTLDAPTLGGRNPEVDEEYQDRLSRELLLSAKTLVTTRDYVLMGDAVIRRLTGEPGRLIAQNNGARNVLVTASTFAGEVLPDLVKDAMTAIYSEYREVNTIFDLSDPTYTTIDVDYAVHPDPGVDGPDLLDRIDEMLLLLLSPAHWSRIRGEEESPSVTRGWRNEPIVRRNKLIDLIGNVQGVDYVEDVTITGDAGSATGVNWTMAGAVPLPRPGEMVGTLV